MRSSSVERRLDRAYEEGYRNAVLDIRESKYDSELGYEWSKYRTKDIKKDAQYKACDRICSRYRFKIEMFERWRADGRIYTNIVLRNSKFASHPVQTVSFYDDVRFGEKSKGTGYKNWSVVLDQKKLPGSVKGNYFVDFAVGFEKTFSLLSDLADELSVDDIYTLNTDAIRDMVDADERY